jgi:hypothetical protein
MSQFHPPWQQHPPPTAPPPPTVPKFAVDSAVLITSLLILLGVIFAYLGFSTLRLVIANALRRAFAPAVTETTTEVVNVKRHTKKK